MPHKYAGLRVADILQLKKGSVRTAPLPPGAPPWADLEAMAWEQVEESARRNEPGFKTVRKLLTDQRFDR
jgi:hypothetical protein